MNYNIEYIFWQKVINAIEFYTDQKIKKDSNYFLYHGMDFTAAFERKVYFELMQKQYIYSIHQASVNNSSVYTQNQIHAKILSFAYPSTDFIPLKNTSTKSYIKNFIYTNHMALNLYLQANSLASQKLPIVKATNLFISIHHKFIRYLSPIYLKCDSPLFVICDDYENSIALCKTHGYQYVLLPSKAKLASMPAKDILSLAITSEKVKFLLSKINPKTIIIPEGNAPIYEIFNIVGKKLNQKTICIQQGWSPIIHNGFRKMHYNLFLTWGEVFSKLLKSHNPDQAFIAVGSHILNLPTGGQQQQDAITFFLQAVTSIITTEIFESFLEFLLWLATIMPNQKIIVREHPSHPINNQYREKLLKQQNLIFMNPDKYTLDQVLSQTKIAVSIYSTVLLEAMLYNAVPFIFNPTAMPNYQPDLAKEGIAIEVKNSEEAKLKIIELLSENETMKKLRRNIKEHKNNYFIRTGEEAMDSILHEIAELTK